MSIKDRLYQLRELMKQNCLDAYIIPDNDFHLSEYTGTYFNSREYMSGFDGSAGTLVVLRDKAGLWTDGRYYIQAGEQLQGSGITLFRQGEEGIAEIEDYLDEILKEGDSIGFDGRVVAAGWGKKLEKTLKKKQIKIIFNIDLVDQIWPERPPLSKCRAYFLEHRYAGESFASKLAKVRQCMNRAGASVHILTSLDDLAWLFNIRGEDVPFNPMVLCFAIITQEQVKLFIEPGKLTEEIEQMLISQGVLFYPYGHIYDHAGALSSDEIILVQKARINYALLKALPDNIKVIEQVNPTTMLKAVKNEIEIKNTREAHLKDGAAVTKFICWLKNNIRKLPLSEISASDYLESLRKKNEGFISLSFPTICGYNEHGAIVHYSATEASDLTLEPAGLLLVDSGGHYFEGTTDITRTIALGPVSDDMKKHFTLVTAGMLRLSAAKFLQGCSGLNLDIIARQPLWENGLDYKHGTGHGVGHLLNVHEGPNNIRFRYAVGMDIKELTPGMITTDEPGIYIEGSHGIRIENELLCQEDFCNEHGRFLKFETLTWAPIDLDAIDARWLTPSDKALLNDYHREVYQRLSDRLEPEEKEWLLDYTRAI